MKKLIIVFAALAFCALPLAADTTFYTDTWSSVNNNNWRVEAGSPLTGNVLYDGSPYAQATRLAYIGGPTQTDYYVQTSFVCDLNYDYSSISYTLIHYLRDGGNGHFYEVDFVGSTASDGSDGGGTISVYLTVVNVSKTLLASTTTSTACGTMKSAIVGSQITVSFNGSSVVSATDSTLASGTLGVGTYGTQNGAFGIGTTTLTNPSETAPPPPTNLAGTAPYSTQINLTWTAPSYFETPTYNIYRNGEFLANAATNSFQDNDPGSWSYTVKTMNGVGNESTTAAGPVVVTTPTTSYSAPDQGGAVDYAVTWGAGPEKVSLLTGALNLRIPLITLKQQSRAGLVLYETFNSQMWNRYGTTDSNIGMDIGYGWGWVVQAGAVYPVFSGSTMVRYEFQDNVGVIRKLFQVGSTNQYTSQDSSYLIWDNVAHTLTFRDGSVWTFNSESGYGNPDAGCRYVTLLTDTTAIKSRSPTGDRTLPG